MRQEIVVDESVLTTRSNEIACIDVVSPAHERKDGVITQGKMRARAFVSAHQTRNGIEFRLTVMLKNPNKTEKTVKAVAPRKFIAD
jgi:hypothetical protein